MSAQNPNNAGRRPLPPRERRSRRLVIMVTDDQRAMIEAAAAAAGLSVSSWLLRECLAKVGYDGDPNLRAADGVSP